MEFLTLWIWNHAWAVAAICDAVALACAVGTVALLKRPTEVQVDTPTPPVKQAALKVAITPRPATLQERGVSPRSRPSAARISKGSRISDDMLTPLPVSKSVSQALAALNRWETTYRPRRGLDELTALAARTRDVPAVHKVNA